MFVKCIDFPMFKLPFDSLWATPMWCGNPFGDLLESTSLFHIKLWRSQYNYSGVTVISMWSTSGAQCHGTANRFSSFTFEAEELEKIFDFDHQCNLRYHNDSDGGTHSNWFVNIESMWPRFSDPLDALQNIWRKSKYSVISQRVQWRMLRENNEHEMFSNQWRIDVDHTKQRQSTFCRFSKLNCLYSLSSVCASTLASLDAACVVTWPNASLIALFVTKYDGNIHGRTSSASRVRQFHKRSLHCYCINTPPLNKPCFMFTREKKLKYWVKSVFWCVHWLFQVSCDWDAVKIVLLLPFLIARAFELFWTLSMEFIWITSHHLKGYVRLPIQSREATGSRKNWSRSTVEMTSYPVIPMRSNGKTLQIFITHRSNIIDE